MKAQPYFFIFLMMVLFLVPSIFPQNHDFKKAGTTQLLISPLPAYFGRIPLSSSAQRDIIIFNVSAQNVTINSIDIQGANQADFVIENQIGSTTLGPLEQLILQVRFTPSVAASEEANLIISSSAGTDTDSLLAWGTRVLNDKITFERIIGGTESDGGNSVVVTADGGFAIVGSTIPSPDVDFPDVYLVKTDRFGAVQWSKNYGGSDSEGGRAIKKTSDGGFVIAGFTDSFGAGSEDGYVIKTDAGGNVQWSKTFGGNKDDNFYDIIPTSDGGYLAAGSTIGADGQNRDAYLVKMNSQGQEEWSKAYGGSSGGEIAYSVVQTADGGYVFVGSTTSMGAGGLDVYLVKVNSSGVEQWHKTFGGSEWEEGSSLQKTADNGFIISGYTVSKGAGARDVYLIKTDGSGNLQWDKTFGFTNNDGGASVKQAADGGYIVVGSTVTVVTQQHQYSDVYIIKTDDSGKLQWSKLYGADKSESAADVQLTADGFIIAGTTDSYSKNSDIYLIKINNDGLITAISHPEQTPLQTFRLLQNYPNPFNGETIIEYHLSQRKRVSLKIFDVTGKLIGTVLNGYQNAGIHRVKFSADQLSSGIYFYQLTDGIHQSTRKMILIR